MTEGGLEGWPEEVMLEAETSGMSRIHMRGQTKCTPSCLDWGLSSLICELGVTIVLPP